MRLSLSLLFCRPFFVRFQTTTTKGEERTTTTLSLFSLSLSLEEEEEEAFCERALLVCVVPDRFAFSASLSLLP